MIRVEERAGGLFPAGYRSEGNETFESSGRVERRVGDDPVLFCPGEQSLCEY